MSLTVNNALDFDKIIAENDLVLVDFFATWCYPCKMLSPILEKAEQDYANVKFVKVDVDRAQELAIRYRIQYMPSLVFIKKGVTAALEVGFKSREELDALIEKYYK